jgi:HK97 family phage prohead protease
MNLEAAEKIRPPRDNLFRGAESWRPELTRDADDDGMPTLHGHFAVFDRWTEIDSLFEGHFLERIAPGAFTKTFKEQRSEMRVLLQHGMDPQAGDKPLGPIEVLEEDEIGGRYSVPLLDTSYNRDIVPGLEAGLYGASFRFRVMREEIEEEPGRSEHNPDGITERTIKEAQVFEFGPVTFPAYQEATAGVRSLRPADLHAALAERELAEAEAVRTTATNSTPAVVSLVFGDETETHDGAEGTSPRPGRTRRYLRRAKYQLPRRGKEDQPPWQIP